ncbi:MAG: hypothetical protein ACUVRA_05180 [Candidatus Bathyarchaeaceae archaeon]
MGFVLESVEKLDEWTHNNGWSGYDPFDVLGTPAILSVLGIKTLALRKIRLPVVALVRLFPKASRLLLRVKKAVNAKAMALFVRAYLNLYECFKKEEYLDRALTCLSWLEKNFSKGYSAYCWGYPFDWQSLMLFPKRTPSGVVSSIAGHAFLDAYDMLGRREYLKVSEDVCRFILNDLNRKEYNKKLCFSYTPLDDYEVHNANLWCASLLARVAFHTKNDLFKKTAIKAVNFTLSDQRDDGAWHYWSTRYAGQKGIESNVIDNYHTGFIIECLMDCDRYISPPNVKEPIQKGINFYVKNLFLDGSIPKWTPNNIYPIDIHSCAQAIITLAKYSEVSKQCLNISRQVALWTIKNMQDEKGFFYYRVYRWGVDKTPYIRWGQAWMLLALSRLCKAYNAHIM